MFHKAFNDLFKGNSEFINLKNLNFLGEQLKSRAMTAKINFLNPGWRINWPWFNVGA